MQKKVLISIKVLISEAKTRLSSSAGTPLIRFQIFLYLLNIVADKLEVIVVMVGCFPSTPKKLAMTIACSLSGAVVLAIGMHLSYVNVEPQRARTMARDKFVLDTLRKKYGYIPPSEARSMARSDSSKENS